MTLKEARAVRDMIRDKEIYCTVPLGHGPNGYFARIVCGRCRDFYSMKDAIAYVQEHDERKLRKQLANKPR